MHWSSIDCECNTIFSRSCLPFQSSGFIVYLKKILPSINQCKRYCFLSAQGLQAAGLVTPMQDLYERFSCLGIKPRFGVVAFSLTIPPGSSETRHQVFVNRQVKLLMTNWERDHYTDIFVGLFVFKNIVLLKLRSRERRSKITSIQT